VKIGIIIINWNSPQYLQHQIISIRKFLGVDDIYVFETTKERKCDQISALLALQVKGDVDEATGDFVFNPVDPLGKLALGSNSIENIPVNEQGKLQLNSETSAKLSSVSANPPIRCSNPYSKREEECKPYKGSSLPQNNKMELPQSGIHIQCVSGHQIAMDDAVSVPVEGKISWKRKFNSGSENKLKGKFYIKSSTGQMLLFDDTEDISEVRGARNGIRLQSATGNYLYFNDHTLPDCKAGEERGVFLGSTSGHALEMSDNGNEQCSPIRKGKISVDDLGREADLDPQIVRKAKGAFVQLSTGYGLMLRMDDGSSQEETTNQFIMLAATPKNDIDGCNNQPHTLLMQLDNSGGGFVQLSSGGSMMITSTRHSMESVGTEDCVANKITQVFGSYLISSEEIYFLKSKTHLDLADKYIILGAGQGCELDEGNAENSGDQALLSAAQAVVDANLTGESQQSTGPCIYPLIIAKNPQVCPFTGFIHWTEYSNTVLGSSN